MGSFTRVPARRPTAYGRFAPSGKTGLQGPHTELHVLKKAIAEMAKEKNSAFSYLGLRGKRAGWHSCPGQVRKHLRRYEKANDIKLPTERKNGYDTRPIRTRNIEVRPATFETACVEVMMQQL